MKRSLSLRQRRIAFALGILSAAGLALGGLTVRQGLNWWPLRSLWSARVTRVTVHNHIAALVVAGAKAQEGTLYDADYVPISYPNGDVPGSRGACTDVVVRALRGAGYDLQRLIHEDMQSDFGAYPDKWKLGHPDANIDHRRVPNQMVFFARKGLKLTTEVSPRTLAQWQPGDFVYWDTGAGRTHTGVVSDGINSAGVPLVIHNGSVCREADVLTQWRIIGHFRFPLPQAALARQLSPLQSV